MNKYVLNMVLALGSGEPATNETEQCLALGDIRANGRDKQMSNYGRIRGNTT